MRKLSGLGPVLLTVALAAGCASSPETPSPQAAGTAPAGVALRDEETLGQVWLEQGFDFTGYGTLYIADTRADVPTLNPDGVENLEWARGVLRTELAAAIEAKKVFAAVVTREADIPPGGKVLRLENTVIEYEKGGGAARYFAGLYGAGQPVIKVRGRLTDAGRALFVFEARRSGVGGRARWLGGVMSDREIQTNDIQDLAKALAEFIARTAKRS